MNHSRNRRDFLTQLSLSGSALVLAPTLLRAASLHAVNPASAHLRGLLPVALVEDCFDLAFVLPELSTLTKTALAGDIDLKIPGNKGRLAPESAPEDGSVAGRAEETKATGTGRKVYPGR